MADFPKGIFFKLPNEKAPDYVKGKVLIKRAEAIEYLQSLNDEWVSLDAKVSKEGKPYLQVDNWKPSQNNSATVEDPEMQDDSPLPF